MSDIPAELIVDVLSWLPVKPLLRFRCVSKPWRALIDSSDFVKLHLNRSLETNSNRSIILRSSYLYSVDFDSPNNAIELDHPLNSAKFGNGILGSCNGLLCLYISKETIVIWNPSTRKYNKLPVVSIEFPVTEGFGYSRRHYGFGYDPVNDDYKVVVVVTVQFYRKNGVSFGSEVRVYSLKSNSWRRVLDFPYYLRYQRPYYGIHANGALHWVVSQKPTAGIANLIAAFDLVTEEYRLVPQPEYSDKNFHVNVDVLGGCLCVLCNFDMPRSVYIWVMKNYGVRESWTKLILVAQPSQIRSFEYVTPIGYSKSGEQVLLEQDGTRLIWYDLKRKTIKKVRVHGRPYHFESSLCLGSLVQVNGGGGSDGKNQQAKEKRKRKRKRKRDDFLSTGFKLVL